MTDKAKIRHTKDGKEVLIRGKLNDGDKHWGMRSNKKFWKKLEVRK